mgnify:FL=1
MAIFYTTDIVDNTARLLGDEFNHCKNVLRSKPGDTITLANGKGYVYKGVIDKFLKDSALISIAESKYFAQENHLHIALAPTKNIDRMEWFVEKAVEIGIETISFIQTKRSERKHINIERLYKIAVSAMKQSGNAYLPIINDIVSWDTFLKTTPLPSVRLIAHLIEGEERKTISELLKNTKETLILIGPEGDFMPDEVENALKNNFLPVSLGKSVLRTETAALYACMAYSLGKS